jgi:hypothetical protein
MSLPESTLSSNPSNPGPRSSGWERAYRRLGAILYVLLCVEIGTFLLVLPWSAIWDRNLLLHYYPLLRPVYMSSYLRGAISGLGLVNLWLGVTQAWSFRRPAVESSAGD